MYKNQLDAPFILSLLSYYTSICFGCISSTSSGGRIYIYIYIYICVCGCVCVCVWQMVIVTILSWLSVGLFNYDIRIIHRNAVLSIIIVTFSFYLSSFFGPFEKLLKASVTFVMTVCSSVRSSVRISAWNNSIFAGRIFMKFNICLFF
jgi:hypothetical protein